MRIPFLRRKPEIIILGAGLAGLSAAHLLKKHRYKLTILEARDRLGGRVHTQIIDPDENLTVELGGEWIGRKHERMLKLCKEFGLKLINHQMDMHLVYKGKYHKSGEWQFNEAWKIRLHKILKALKLLNEKELLALDTIDLWHYLLSHHISYRDLEFFELIESTNFGESIRFVPSYNLLTHTYMIGHSGESADHYRIDGGNSQLPSALAKKIGIEHVKLEHKVTSIHQYPGGVAVHCSNGKVYKADIIICTLPTFAITQIHWDPIVPEEQFRAFAGLNYGRITKTAVLYPNRFWQEEHFSLLTDRLPHYIYHSTNGQKGTKGVLTSYAVGDKAYLMSQLDNEGRVEEINNALKIAFKDTALHSPKTIHYYWGDDPYTKGAYAVFEPHQSLEFRDLLKRPFNNIYFAGEHLADHQGFMEGAVETGQGVAERIIKLT